MNLAQLVSGVQVLPNEATHQIPKLQLSPGFVWCTPEFRVEYNAWLRDRFGTRGAVLIVNYADVATLVDPEFAAQLFLHLHTHGFTL